MGMVVQEGGPRLRGEMRAPLSHVFLDRAFGDVNAQFEQLSSNPFSSPQAIVQRHRLNQSDGLGSDSGLP
jgi:hypothetical protein